MEFLTKRILAFFAILLLSITILTAQETQSQKAFKDSYTAELTGDYTAAISAIQKVYQTLFCLKN